MINFRDNLPRKEGFQPSAHSIEHSRLQNQFVVKGVNPEFPNPATLGGNPRPMAVFLTYVQATTTFEIQDRNGNSVATGLVSPLDLGHSPLRLDGGFRLVGTITAAIGFHVSIPPE